MELAGRLDRFRGRRGLAALGVLASFGLATGYGVAVRAHPKPLRIPLASGDARPRSPGIVAVHGRAIAVHVAGAVARPGVYRMQDGDRVDDAIRAAGGATPGADLDALNLAARVRDGDKVMVPAKGATPAGAPGAAASSGDRVNINTADAASLDKLPGVGPALAQRIVEYRQAHGGFHVIEDLQKVAGIGPRKFADLQEKVTV